MLNSSLLGMLVRVELEMGPEMGPETAAAVSGQAMAELEGSGLEGSESVACSMSGRATPHHPEDNGSHCRGPSPNILHMHPSLSWHTAGMVHMRL